MKKVIVTDIEFDLDGEENVDGILEALPKGMELEVEDGFTDEEIEEFGATIEAHRNCFIDYSEYLKAAPVKRTFVGCAIEYMTAYAKYLAVKLICLIR